MRMILHAYGCIIVKGHTFKGFIMPDFWSHHYAARAANDKRLLTNPKFLNWSSDSNALYDFGAQGPDFFYYINKFNLFTKHRFSHIGNSIHEIHVKELFREMIGTIIDEHSEEKMAYIAGFLSHYILDVYCHPLICKLGPDSNSHKRVELDLEAFCIHDYWKLEMSSFDVEALRCDVPKLQKGCVEVWETVLPICYNESVEKTFILQGHKDLLRLQKMLVNDTVSKLPFQTLLSKLFHYDLTMLQFPEFNDESLKKLRLYDTFKGLYSEGIEAISNALILLDRVLANEITLDQFIETTIKYDFLGEVITDVRKST